MSKTEIFQELPKLAAEERREIAAKLRELDGGEEVNWLDDGEVTGEGKCTIPERLAVCEEAPNRFIPWAQAKARLKAEFRRRKLRP